MCLRSRKFFVFDFVTAVVVALKRPFVGLGYGHSSPLFRRIKVELKAGASTSFGEEGGWVTDASSPLQGPLGEHQGISVLSGLSTLPLELPRLHNETELRPPT